jgi:hypothetical protein
MFKLILEMCNYKHNNRPLCDDILKEIQQCPITLNDIKYEQ